MPPKTAPLVNCDDVVLSSFFKFDFSAHWRVSKLLIGPGTGIALPLALIEHRAVEAGANRSNVLYFGCRHADADHLYPHLSQHDALQRYCAVFSRDDDDKKLRYVQHALKRDSALIRSFLLEHNAHVVLCGSAEKVRRQFTTTFTLTRLLFIDFVLLGRVCVFVYVCVCVRICAE